MILEEHENLESLETLEGLGGGADAKICVLTNWAVSDRLEILEGTRESRESREFRDALRSVVFGAAMRDFCFLGTICLDT